MRLFKMTVVAVFALTALTFANSRAEALVVPITSGTVTPFAFGEIYSFAEYIPAGTMLSYGFKAPDSLVVGKSATTTVSLEEGKNADFTASWTSGSFGTGLKFNFGEATGDTFTSLRLDTEFSLPNETRWLNIYSELGATAGGQVLATPVPLPAALPLLLVGLGGLGLFGWRKRRTAAA